MTPTHKHDLFDQHNGGNVASYFLRSTIQYRLTRRIGFLLVLFWILVSSSTIEAQTTVFTDDFNADQSVTYTTSGAIGASAWSVTRSGADFGARRNTSPAQLELTNDVGATANANGWVLASTPSSSFTGPYNTTLNSNTGVVTWTFNMQQVRADPAGFGAGSYGLAFILAGTSNTNNNTGSGYAVVLGQSGASDPIRLARYNGGIQGTVTNIIVSNTAGLTDFGAEYLSIKVTYTPATDTWELFLRNDGASAFADPAAGSLTSQGTLVDSTSTGTSLPLMGAWWQGSTGLSQPSFFDNTTVTVDEPTAVRLTGFAAVQNGAEVVLQWQSGSEARNLGYNVYREQDGKRVAITPSLVAGSALIAGRQTALTAGLNYTWYDQIESKAQSSGQKADSETSGAVMYWLEDVDLDGTRTLHGPIAPLVQYKPKQGGPRAALLNELTGRTTASGVEFAAYPAAVAAHRAHLASPLVSDADAIALQQRIEARHGIKIAVSKAGWYRVTQPELAAAGLDPNVNAAQLQLYANGRPVPIKQSGDEVHLTSSDYIEFYGQGVDSSTDANQTYYLVIEPDHFGSRIRDLVYRNPKPLPPPSGPTSFAYTVERRERMIYFSGLRNGEVENFFGQVVTNTPVASTMPVNNLDAVSVAAGTPAQLEVSLQGVTNQGHLVKVVLNGTDLGTVSFANTDHETETFALPAAALHNGDNTVEFTSLGGAADVSLVDTLRLTYAHGYTADENALVVNIDSEATRRISGFTSNNIRVVDITKPADVLELTETAKVNKETGGTYSVDLQVQAASFRRPHTLRVFADNSALSAAVKCNEPSTWWSQTAGADYLMISTGALKASVEALAQLRRNQGMVVQVVDVEDLYDEFTFGQHSPQAIHGYLARAMNTWTRKPHYLLLAGDASYDPKNYLGQGINDLVPTKLIDTNLMEAASDDWLADFNNDGIAELALGRLPVRTAADMNALVAKIVWYENAAPDPSRSALLVADTSFEGQSRAVQSVLPAGMTVAAINRSSADDATIHNQIITAINQGPRVTNFVGHGSNGVWTGGSVLSSYDAPTLTNTNRLSVFTMMTCFNGYFQDAYNDSLSEALLKAPAGAVAVWASTTLTEPAGQNAIDQEFYRMLFRAQPATLGDAARTAKAFTADADVRRTWTLFGDPAMRLR